MGLCSTFTEIINHDLNNNKNTFWKKKQIEYNFILCKNNNSE